MGLLLFFLIAGALCGGFQEENKSSRRRGNSYDYNNDLRDWIQYRKQHGYE